MKKLDQFRGERGKVLIEVLEIGKGARREKQAFGLNRLGKHVLSDSSSARSGHAYHLTWADVIMQSTFVDRGSISPVMARGIGVRAEMNGRVQGGQGNVVPAAQVAEHFPAWRRVARPDLQPFGYGRADVVEHRCSE